MYMYISKYIAKLSHMEKKNVLSPKNINDASIDPEIALQTFHSEVEFLQKKTQVNEKWIRVICTEYVDFILVFIPNQ